MALDRWYPHLVLAGLTAPLGVLVLAASIESMTGSGLFAAEIADLEHRVVLVGHRPLVEAALGVSLIVMSLGLALRSSLAWLGSVSIMATAIALRMPPETTDLPTVLYFGAVLLLLLVHRRSFVSHSVFSAALFSVGVTVSFFIWAVLGTLRLGEQFEPPVRDLATSIYVTVVTVSSVGFGDIVARQPEARFFVAAEILVGLLVVATAFSAVLLPLIGGRVSEIMRGGRRLERYSHYVVVGHSPLARNVTTELERRREKVTLIVSTGSEDSFYKDRDLVVGDPTDLSVLRAAGAEQAKAVLALATDDATNGFVVLGVNELDATVQTVAALNDPANQFRLKRTQPSMLLSLQALGGQLLAMALTGERVDVDMLARVLQVHGDQD